MAARVVSTHTTLVATPQSKKVEQYLMISVAKLNIIRFYNSLVLLLPAKKMDSLFSDMKAYMFGRFQLEDATRLYFRVCLDLRVQW